MITPLKEPETDRQVRILGSLKTLPHPAQYPLGHRMRFYIKPNPSTSFREMLSGMQFEILESELITVTNSVTGTKVRAWACEDIAWPLPESAEVLMRLSVERP